MTQNNKNNNTRIEQITEEEALMEWVELKNSGFVLQ